VIRLTWIVATEQVIVSRVQLQPTCGLVASNSIAECEFVCHELQDTAYLFIIKIVHEVQKKN